MTLVMSLDSCGTRYIGVDSLISDSEAYQIKHTTAWRRQLRSKIEAGSQLRAHLADENVQPRWLLVFDNGDTRAFVQANHPDAELLPWPPPEPRSTGPIGVFSGVST
jgi:hypothetical protein